MAIRWRSTSENAGTWQRHVIDDSLADGHTILTADLNGDGSDEVIAGYRGKGVNVYYAQDAKGAEWTKTVLDSEHAGRGLRHRGFEWRRASGYRVHRRGHRESEVVRKPGPVSANLE
jgi:asparagine synthetase B (glutamine-hydrolysing)